MKRVDIVNKGDQWVAESGSAFIAKAKTKDDAVHKTAQVARAMLEAVSVKIHILDGKIQEERT